MVAEGLDASPPLRVAIEDPVAAAVRSIGPRNILRLLPITAEIALLGDVRDTPTPHTHTHFIPCFILTIDVSYFCVGSGPG